MAKRFTDTDKWKKHFIRSLPAEYKLLWCYIVDDCGHDGIWEVDIETAQFRLGVKLNKSEAERLFSEKIIVLSNGQKWFIHPFIEFQYSELKENNKAHTKVIQTLKKFFLLDDNLNLVFRDNSSPLEAPWKPLVKGAKDMDKDKEVDKEMVKDKDKDKGGKSEKVNVLVMPFSSDDFTEMWAQWKKYKKEQFKFDFKSTTTEQAAINDLVTKSGGHEPTAINIILQSIGNGWKGFFELKTNNNGNAANKQSGNSNRMETELEAIFRRNRSEGK